MTYPYLEPRAEYDVARYEAMLDAAQAQAQADYEAALCDGETTCEKLAWECGKPAFAGGITRWHASQRLSPGGDGCVGCRLRRFRLGFACFCS